MTSISFSDFSGDLTAGERRFPLTDRLSVMRSDKCSRREKHERLRVKEIRKRQICKLSFLFSRLDKLHRGFCFGVLSTNRISVMSKDMNTQKGLDMVDIGRIVADVLVAGSDTVATVVTVRAIRSVLHRDYSSNLSRSRRYICSCWIQTNSKLCRTR